MRTILIILAIAVVGLFAFLFIKKMSNPFNKLGTPPPTSKNCGELADFFKGHVGRKNAVAPTVISNYTGADKKTAEGIAEIAGKFDVSAYAENYVGEKLASWLCGKDLGDILSSIGGGIVDGAKAVGSAIGDAASAVGGGIKDAAVFVGEGVADGAKAVGSGVASGAKAVGKAATSDTGKAIATGGLSVVGSKLGGLFGSKSPPKDASGNFVRTGVSVNAGKPGVVAAGTPSTTGRRNTERATTLKGTATPKAPTYAPTQAERAAATAASGAAAQAAAEAAKAGTVLIAPPKTTAGTTTYTKTTPTLSLGGKKTL